MPGAAKADNRNQLRQQGLALLRKAKLLPLAEWTYGQIEALKIKDHNAAYLKAHPDFVPPPLPLMRDAYRSVSYEAYVASGTIEAGVFADLIKKHHGHAKRILEWGCGPARVLRHLPGLLPEANAFYGADYNKDSIRWCKSAFPNITFAAHGLTPPLPFAGEKFDAIYAISVITHLSVELQEAWVAELTRSLMPGGILIITTHGEACKHVLLPSELAEFDAGGVIIRSGVEEGKRCYTSYHHPRYARERLFKNLTVLEHIPNNPCPHTAQDIWVLKVKA